MSHKKIYDKTLSNADPILEVEFDNSENADREQWMDFTVIGGDSPVVALDRELVSGSGYQPFSKSPTDLTQVTFNASHAGVGLNDIARVGKLKYTLSGAAGGSTVRVIVAA
jgi:hypothetical protein